MSLLKDKLQQGFQLDEPQILIPWGLVDSEAMALFSSKTKKIGNHNISVMYIKAKIFGADFYCDLGLYFYDSKLKNIVIKRQANFFAGKDFEQAGVESFQEIQPLLEKHFGKPNLLGYLHIPFGYKNERRFKWHIGKIKIEHSYGDSVRGFEEQLTFSSN